MRLVSLLVDFVISECLWWSYSFSYFNIITYWFTSSRSLAWFFRSESCYCWACDNGDM